MSIKVEVCSPVLPLRDRVVDVYRPKLHSFTDDVDSVDPEHIDVVITWKGLSIAQAREVVFWEQAAKAALESYVEELLIASIDALWAESSEHVGCRLSFLTLAVSPSNLEAMCKYINDMGPQTLLAPLESLTRVMVQYQEAFGSQYTWLINKSDPICAIANFLRVFDFFDQEASNHCRFRFNMIASVVEVVDEASSEDPAALPDRILHVYAVLSPHPHRLSFVSAACREWKPYYREPWLSNDVPAFSPDVSITSVGCHGMSASITVQKHFPEFGRFERVYRVHTRAKCFSMAPSGGVCYQPQPSLHLQSGYHPRYGSSSSTPEPPCDSGGTQMPASRTKVYPGLGTHERNLDTVRRRSTKRRRDRLDETAPLVFREVNWDVSTLSVSDENARTSTNWSSFTPGSREDYAKGSAFPEFASSPVSSPSFTGRVTLAVRNMPEGNVDAASPSLELRGGLEDAAHMRIKAHPFGPSMTRKHSDCGAQPSRWSRLSTPRRTAFHDVPTREHDIYNYNRRNGFDLSPLGRDTSSQILGLGGIRLLSTSNTEAFPYYVSVQHRRVRLTMLAPCSRCVPRRGLFFKANAFPVRIRRSTSPSRHACP
jgi:hypothetical protein